MTFRLFDSLPKALLIQWKEDLRPEKCAEAESNMRRRVEAYLDQGHGSCYLRNVEVATMVQSALLFHDRLKYRLSAWVVMPNHVHLLCTPLGYSLAQIMHSIKSFTASGANKMLNRADDSGKRNISIDIFGMRDTTPKWLLILRIIR